MIPLSAPVKKFLPLIFAVVMGLVAVGLVRRYLGQQRRALELERQRLMVNYQDPVDVVVAAKDLPAGVTLEPAHLTLAKVPERFVQPYATRTPQQLVGMVTGAPIAEGEQVLLNKIRRPEDVPTGATLSDLTPKGKRAVTVSVDIITGVGGFIQPGDTVDVLWTLKLPAAGQQEGQVVTLTLFQDVPILAVAHEFLGQSKRPVKPAEAEHTVTLALSPQETAFLLFAREQGRIQLSLRSQLDGDARVVVSPASINTLMEQLLGGQAGASAKAPRQVEVYKGLKRDVVVLSEQQ